MRLTLFPVLLLCATPLLGIEVFVAPSGNDAWTGRLAAANAEGTDGPFATLERARDEVRKHPDEPRTVTLRGGLYALPKGFTLGAADSGTAAAPALWRAYEKEQPILIGGLPIRDWKPGKEGIMEADVAAQGFKGIAFKQLLFAGKRQILARYPNYDPKNPYGGGWAYADGEIGLMYADREGENNHTLAVKPADRRTWERPTEVEVFVFARYNWWNNILPVKAVDSATGTITTSKDASYAMRGNDRYFVQGAREELDAPGEWYLDRKSGVLSFIPPAPLETGTVYAPTTRDIFKLDGVQHLTVRGLTFECAEGSAIQVRKSSHCRVTACTVRNVGDYSGNGISIAGGFDVGVVGCDISFTGSSGIALDGGDRPMLVSSGHFADNCYIHHVGVYHKQGVGVALGGVGQRVSHCLIHDAPRFGIMFGGNNHVLEYNHLRHLALETEDVGATYCGGRDFISPRGTVIRYNYIHDILGYGWNGKWTSPYFAWGIYLDDNSGGVDVIGNIVARCGRSLIHGHSARDCRVENNIFIEGGLRQWEFNGWTTRSHFWEKTLPQMEKGYQSVVNEPAWRFVRGMQIPPGDLPDSEGRVMSGNNFQRNIMYWKNADARALNVVAMNSDRNVFDRNLYWNGGNPLKTGIRKSGKVLSGNLVGNPGFEEGEPGKLPTGWTWQIRPRPEATAALVVEGEQRFLRIPACFNAEKKRDNYPIVVARDVELTPGHAYRLRARMRSDRPEGKAQLQVQCYLPPANGKPAHFWSSSPADAKVGNTWAPFEFSFTIPAEGEKGWHPEMKRLRVRIDWPEKEGTLDVDDVVLEETEALDEWQSWLASGGDRHSLVADPRFIAPEKDDYRLAPDSPALQLGFQPLPFDKMGPYASEDRASWPIVEAEGAREHPLTP